MAPSHSVTITMDQETVHMLQGSGSSLYGFKGVQTKLGGGAPLVWFQARRLSLSVPVTWQRDYQAYTSLDAIIPNGRIMPAWAYDIDPGQTLDVTRPDGTGEVVSNGTPSAISINNLTTARLACGMSQLQQVTNASSPSCVFPLHGNTVDVMMPIELVMLTFSPMPVNPGTVIYQALAEAILVDLSIDASITVVFDIHKGWTTTHSPHARPIPAGADIAPLLIKP